MRSFESKRNDATAKQRHGKLSRRRGLQPESSSMATHSAAFLSPLVRQCAPSSTAVFQLKTPTWKPEAMNVKISALLLSGLLATCSLYAIAAEDKDPKTALPVDNTAQPKESNHEKANKSGEEASGGNAGADTETLKKEAATSKGEKQEGK